MSVPNVDEDDKFQNIDDLDLLELLIWPDVLMQYDFRAHVASDVCVGQRFLPPASTKTQSYHEGILSWTHKTKLGKI